MGAEILPAGKLRPETLARLLRHTSIAPELVIGPAVGEDAAVIDIGNRYLVVTTDPITFTTDRCGWYSVCVNANDIAACGGTPLYYSASIIFPEGETALNNVEALFVEIEEVCRQMGILWVGGHTEVSATVNNVLVAGQMIGEVKPDHLCRSSDAQIGAALVLVKAAAIEATAIIATEKAEELEAAHGIETVKKSQNFLLDPGITVVSEAALARDFPVNAMHDPTEGGVATGVREICMASGCGVLVEENTVTVLPETRALCRQFDLIPLGAISSGALLLTISKEAAADLIRQFEQAKIPAAIVGEILPPDAGLQLREVSGQVIPLPEFEVDEITKLYR
jgi:hydrogenase maturation factor